MLLVYFNVACLEFKAALCPGAPYFNCYFTLMPDNFTCQGGESCILMVMERNTRAFPYTPPPPPPPTNSRRRAFARNVESVCIAEVVSRTFAALLMDIYFLNENVLFSFLNLKVISLLSKFSSSATKN